MDLSPLLSGSTALHERPRARPLIGRFFVMDEHCGTRFDALTHFVASPDSGLLLAGDIGAQTGDRVPLEDFVGPAVVVEVSYLSGQGEPTASPFVEPEHVSQLEEEHGALFAGEVVLFRTD